MSNGVTKVIAAEVLRELPDSAPKALRIMLNERKGSYVFKGNENGKINVITFCIPRHWDSQFFEKEMATLNTYIVGDSVIDPKNLNECVSSAIDETCKDKVACIFSRVGLGTPIILRACEERGFRTYDVGCSFIYQSIEAQDDQMQQRELVVEATDSDVWKLISLASNLYELDHYHQDSRIGKDAADAMYGIWIRNLFFDDKCRVAVTKESGKITGFITIRELLQNQTLNDSNYLIDLIGVSNEYRGRGIGHGLLDWALTQVSPNSVISVATQLTNIRAIQLYLSKGFRPSSYYATMHLWH